MKIIEELIGKTFANILNKDNEELIFKGDKSYCFYHDQDCCESVNIVDICGDLSDLENSPILKAEERVSENVNPKGLDPLIDDDSFTWTFYEFATIKGSVTVRWFGSSNGYYSEKVDFRKI